MKCFFLFVCVLALIFTCLTLSVYIPLVSLIDFHFYSDYFELFCVLFVFFQKKKKKTLACFFFLFYLLCVVVRTVKLYSNGKTLIWLLKLCFRLIYVFFTHFELKRKIIVFFLLHWFVSVFVHGFVFLVSILCSLSISLFHWSIQHFFFWNHFHTHTFSEMLVILAVFLCSRFFLVCVFFLTFLFEH